MTNSYDFNILCPAAGYGPQKLATLAAYALRRNLLDWLETFKVEKVCAAQMRCKIPQVMCAPHVSRVL